MNNQATIASEIGSQPPQNNQESSSQQNDAILQNVDNTPNAGLASAPPPRRENLVRLSSNGSIIESDDGVSPPFSPNRNGSLISGPPPAETVDRSPTPTPQQDQEMEDEQSSSRWHSLPEDTSSPNEVELKEIEDKIEHSAEHHQYWESQTFFELPDPEHTPIASGRIEWVVDNYNGTKETPNQEVLMRSPVASIGGYDWQIKFYPQGNDSDYLSVYLECVSLTSNIKEDVGQKSPSQLIPRSSRTQQKPLPSLEDFSQKAPTERPSVAAQFSIVLYNPNESRVNHFHSYTHRFCPKCTDWGSTRFHGPFYRICYREPYERQALLRNDTLAFTAYIRIVDDATGCLWEHPSDSNPWDSSGMTGLHSLSNPTKAADGNFSAAISSWMLLRPFRHLLYSIRSPDPSKDARTRPMPIIEQLQKLLFRMRQSKRPRSGTIALDDLMDKFNYYGLLESIRDMDVVQIWDVLRAKIEEELQGTPWTKSMGEIFGQSEDMTRVTTSRRLKVKGRRTITEAIKYADLSFARCSPTPSVYCLELERQTFDTQSRRWKKLTDRVSLEDRVIINGEPFILFGHVSHRGELQSGSYYSTLRPLGIGTKWYRYNNRSSDHKVTCITQKEAIQEEGFSSSKSSREINKGLAYIVIYLREQAFRSFQTPEPEWSIPEWLQSPRHDVDSLISGILDTRADEILEITKSLQHDTTSFPAQVDLEIIDSTAFESSQGPGIFSPFEQASTDSLTMPFLKIQATFPATATLKDVQTHLEERLPDVRARRQCALFIIDSRAGYINRPRLRRWHGHDDLMLNLGVISQVYPENRLWLHVVPAEDIHQIDEDGEPMDTTASIAVNDSWGSLDGSASNANRIQDTSMEDATTSKSEVYFFLKTFDVCAQSLAHVGSHMACSEETLEVIHKLFNLSKQVDLFEETSGSCRKLCNSRTFVQENLRDGAIIIARGPVTDPMKHSAEGRFIEPVEFIAAHAAVRNLYHSSSGHLARSYFSSSYFNGTIFQGRPHGLGEHISLSNNECYRGEFALGQRHGHGRLIYANGNVYEGGFEAGLPNGKGTLVELATGNEYSGGWKNGKKHGQGMTLWKQAEDESGKRCKICWESDADSAFLHCGHVAACMECAQDLDDCPVCRGRVAGVLKLWFVS